MHLDLHRARIVRQLLRGCIVVVGRNLALKGLNMELLQQAKREARLGVRVRGWVPLPTNQLLPPGTRGYGTVAEIDRNRMNAVGMDDEEVAMSWAWVGAGFVVDVPKLHTQTKASQGHTFKMSPIPFLVNEKLSG